MLDLNDLYAFCQVIDRKSYTAAAKAMGVPKSTLSHRITRLESRIGARLIQRTSRSFSVTDIGQVVYRHARGMLIEAEAAESAASERIGEPRGTVRFTCPAGMDQELAGVLAAFLERYPRVNLVQHATNRFVDLVEEGFDVGLRGHGRPLADSSLVQRALARTPFNLYAGSGFLERLADLPREPGALRSLHCLALGHAPNEHTWHMRHADGTEASVSFVPRVSSDDMATVKALALANQGIVALPAYVCREAIRRGELKRILPGWTAGEGHLTLLVPTRRGVLPAVRAFIDFLAEEFPKIAEE